MSRFGRSRVQDHAADSDDIPVTHDSPARPDAPALPDAGVTHGADRDNGAPTFFDQQRIGPGDPENDRAIDALRAATTAAGAQPPQQSVADAAPEDIAQIRKLHATTLATARRGRRMLAPPGARRKAEYAAMAETAALQMLGFTSYEQFVVTHGETSDDARTESDETIARIRVLLTELGVDPLGDPLRAASDFLTAHESELTDRAESTNRSYMDDVGVIYMNPAPESAAAKQGVSEPRPSKMDWSKPISPFPDEPAEATRVEATSVDEETRSEQPRSEEPRSEEPLVEEPVVHAPLVGGTVPGGSPVEDPVVEETAVEKTEVEKTEVEEPVAEDAPAVEEQRGDETVAPPEPEAPWVAAAQIPIATPPELESADEDVVDRWINAEARAERMHAEVDRAQAELVAMLARSADLEQTVVSRADELDLANEELERVRRRVEELEQSIARTDAERDEIDRALTTSRERVAELEAALLDREEARAQADRERAMALAAVSELESTLTARTSELELARINVAELESALITQAAQFADERGDIGVARAVSDELTVELENTKRALDALDAHAEAIEAELAEARRTADSPETRRELDAVREELTQARHELGHLELQRAETDRSLAHDRIELQQLQHTLASTRDEAIDALDELTEIRRNVEAMREQVELAERARDAVTIDAAEVIARAEAQATNVLERANRDAEAIRQEAMYEHELGGDFRRADGGSSSDETLRDLADQVDRLERKLAKQRRRLDRITRSGGTGSGRVSTDRSKVTKATGSNVMVASGERGGSSPAEVIASAEREAAEIRQAARRDRERFREEIIGLLSRLATVDDGTDTDDFDDFDD